MNLTYLIIGLSLQAGCFLSAGLFARTLYSMSWAGGCLVSVPMFLASPYFLMNCGLPLVVRLVLSFWIVSIPLYILAEVGVERLQVTREIFLIPAGFRGEVIVEMHQSDGVPAEVESGCVVFRVGADGRLRSQARERHFSYSRVNDARDRRREFYFADAQGVRTRIARPDRDVRHLNPADLVIIEGAGEHFEAGRLLRVDFRVDTTAEIVKSLGIPV